MENYPHFLYGGDYNPEQWLDYDGIIDEDFKIFKKAGINALTVGMFAWAKLEPEEGVYDFSWLDDIFERANANGMKIVLGTPSGARPIWLARKYPEVLRVNANRTRNLIGGRHNHCYTSPVYREKVVQIDRMLARRYAGNPALILWHISNEYGGECHCPLCQEAFRNWLKQKYHNNLDELNEQYWSAFWSHTYTDWDQIEGPAAPGLGSSMSNGLNLDWKRFVTYQTTEFFKAERDAVKEFTPDVPVTTNLMGVYTGLDYRTLARESDIVSWDSYPRMAGPNEDAVPAAQAFRHDLMRGVGNGKPYLMMESTPSLVNWADVNKMSRPGQLKMMSMQALAHGSDSVQFFQMRKSRGSFEKLHGAVIDHSGHDDTRVIREVSDLGADLKKLDDIVGTGVKSEVAIIYDWENRWALDDAQGFKNFADSDKKGYLSEVLQHYRCFWSKGISTDIIGMKDDFSGYRMIIAPMLYLCPEDTGRRLSEFVAAGGVLVTGYCSGMVNENDLVHMGEFPGAGLNKVCGVWNEETDALYDGQTNGISAFGKTYQATDYCAIIHSEGAEVLGRYETDFYAGMPAVTANRFGEGEAYYIAFRGDDGFLNDFYENVLVCHPVTRNLDTYLPQNVTVSRRVVNDREFLFIENYNAEPRTVALDNRKYIDMLAGERVSDRVNLNAYEVKVLRTVSPAPGAD